MSDIAIAMFFLMIDLNITINGCVICLTPTFIGYIYLAKGCWKFDYTSEALAKLISPSILMAVLSALHYIFIIIISSEQASALHTIFDLIELIISFTFTFRVIEGIAELETQFKMELGYEKLQRSAIYICILFILTYFPGMFIPLLGTILSVISFAATIRFLFLFNRTKYVYAEYPVTLKNGTR